MSINLESARELYRAFEAQGVTTVFAVQCCKRFYLGLDPARKCRTCTKTPKNVEIRSEADLDNLESA